MFRPEKFPDALTIGHLIRDGRLLSVDCGTCGRNRLMEPETLPLAHSLYVPALKGRFRCSRCGSRQTSARPDYSHCAPKLSW